MTTNQGRVLGIDYGTRRVGLALSDPLRILATSYGALLNTPELFERIKEVITKEQIILVVVGLPLSLSGKKTSKALEVESFVEMVRSRCHIEVVSWDERFTTSMAQQSLLTMGTKRKDRRRKDGRVDSMAAAIMLQGFLDSTKQSMSC
ncbi:MAG TPA: Holliday junction resolvase RuvX [Bacteroidota bacterium]|nr:Holliday junction resolvase RuvX [Bacteroidota bacterium]